jgi:hypothetical protein
LSRPTLVYVSSCLALSDADERARVLRRHANLRVVVETIPAPTVEPSRLDVN